MSRNIPVQMTAHPTVKLSGHVKIPGDKSISHRAVLLGALCIGTTRVSGLLESEDVLATINAVRKWGAEVERTGDGCWIIDGVGTGGFAEPSDIIDCGNSGTSARLLMGAMSTTPIVSTFTGDTSLRTRPMGRIIRPLSLIGARFYGRRTGRLPQTVVGTDSPLPLDYVLPVPSAQVKSSILLAGLNIAGRTVVTEPVLTRDHTEIMLRSFGAQIEIEESDQGRKIALEGYANLLPQNVEVPGDPSSAAFVIAAILITEQSSVLLQGIGMNPTRTGLIACLQEMGAGVSVEGHRFVGGEPVADLVLTSTSLRGIEVPSARSSSMIDEYPALAAIAAFAEGDTVMRGVGELRVKESDRISAMVNGLRACGVSVEEFDDGLTIHGLGRGSVKGSTTCQSCMDHRVAMSLLCVGLGARNPVSIDDATPIATSFPQFVNLMKGLGARIEVGEPAEKPNST